MSAKSSIFAGETQPAKHKRHDYRHISQEHARRRRATHGAGAGLGGHACMGDALYARPDGERCDGSRTGTVGRRADHRGRAYREQPSPTHPRRGYRLCNGGTDRRRREETAFPRTGIPAHPRRRPPPWRRHPPAVHRQ